MTTIIPYVVLLLPAIAASYTPWKTVKLGSSSTSFLATKVCQGLYSRNRSTAVYTISGSNDELWLNFTGGSAPETVTTDAFEKQCLVDFPRFVRYNYSAQKELLPEIVSMASALDAVPVEDEANVNGASLAFDAVKVFDGFTELDAVAYAYNHHGKNTTGVAKLNPGWHWDNDPLHQLNPKLTGGMPTALVDFVVKQKLFLFFLVRVTRLSAFSSVLVVMAGCNCASYFCWCVC
jgi:hypothetical protein